ncbi:hypothetical protein [Tessaracoccus lacteus]|uniref:Uncharacterized protein n=1 Tax=Tessaracoccus lacteus TaxID=3041766 RepID=A0ABY8PVB1_9ACTN|nr:hypothetical protein [Tessaracoccus sp. T21]WGT46358.1 hypothetical protein QH948_09350 [Tessaracoccus sp. T21]
MSMLPLEVFPGWPTPEPTSSLFMVLLTIVGPLAFGAVLALLAFAPKLRREATGTSTSTEVATTRDDA